MKNNLYIIYCLLLTLFSCSVITNNKSVPPLGTVDQEWKYLLNMQNEKWNREKTIQILGNPTEVFNDVKSKNIYLIYRDKNTNHQNWSIGLKDDQLTSISFFPNLSNENNFSFDQISKYWGNNCVKKVEVDSSKPYVLKKTYLDCGLGRKARINNLEQVEGLFIEF